MNIKEHLLVCLAEEAAEVAQDCDKSLRFGLDDINVLNPTGPSNRERLIVELNQLLGVVFMLVTIGELPRDWADPQIQMDKIEKVREFMEYARTKGALQ
jgi:hypothetical protein